MQYTLWEALDCCASIAKQDTAGAMAVQHLVNDGRRRPTAVYTGGQIGGDVAVLNLIDQVAQLAVTLFLFLEAGEVVEAGGVQQAQSGKM